MAGEAFVILRTSGSGQLRSVKALRAVCSNVKSILILFPGGLGVHFGLVFHHFVRLAEDRNLRFGRSLHLSEA